MTRLVLWPEWNYHRWNNRVYFNVGMDNDLEWEKFTQYFHVHKWGFDGAVSWKHHGGYLNVCLTRPKVAPSRKASPGLLRRLRVKLYRMGRLRLEQKK